MVNFMRPINDYLKCRPGLKGQILDHGELKRVARACGLSPEDARSELKRLGFTLTKNIHGLAVWRKEANQSHLYDSDEIDSDDLNPDNIDSDKIDIAGGGV